jgi:NAD(P)H-dependent FMN reductase
MKLVGICGSLRDGSYTFKALEHALESAESDKVETHLVDLREVEMPVFSPDRDRTEDLEEVSRLLQEADGIVLATPMYHGSYSSPIKTLIDHMGFDEFENKTIGLLGVSGGRFPLSALDHLRTVCKALDAWVLPYEAAIPQAGSKFNDGELEDETRKRLEELAKRTVKFSRIEPNMDTLESHENVGAEGK